MPKTYIANCRVAAEDVATMVAFLRQNEDFQVGRSIPIIRGFELAAEIVRKNHPDLTFNFQEAIEYLSTMGFDPAHGRSARPLVRALQDIELTDVPSGPRPTNHPSECFQPTEPEFDAIQRRKREEEELAKVFANLGEGNIDVAEDD